mmetsp:Transcript_42979/g.99549  ORF Transcript_42979/g.99549 Transcript_42979/m.99549 type:complete len:304 (-) Transcript_42979:505-1416(-)
MKNVGRKMTLHELLFCLIPIDLSISWVQLVKLGLVLRNYWRNVPLGLVHRLLACTPDLHHSERSWGACHLRNSSWGNSHSRLLIRDNLEEPGKVCAQELFKLRHLLRVQRLECGEIQRCEELLHHTRVGEVTERKTLRLRYLVVDARQGPDHPLLLLSVPEKGGHIAVQVVHEEGVHFCKACPLDEVVDLAHSCCAWKLRYQRVQVVGFLLEELPQVFILEWFVPERPNINSRDLWRVDDFAKRPHQGTIGTHQLLSGHPIRLVQDDVDLVVVAARCQNHTSELVRDVQLRDIKEEKNHVHTV